MIASFLSTSLMNLAKISDVHNHGSVLIFAQRFLEAHSEREESDARPGEELERAADTFVELP